METTIVYWGVYRDNGTENGNYCNIIGFKIWCYRGYLGILHQKMKAAT